MCLHAHATLGSHCCCFLTTNCIQDPVWAHCNKQNQREPTIQNTQDSKVLKWTGGLMEPGFIYVCTLDPLPSSQQQQTPFTTDVWGRQADAKKLEMLMNLFWSDWGQWMSLAQLSHQCKRKISLVNLVGFFHLLISDVHLGVQTDIHK